MESFGSDEPTIIPEALRAETRARVSPPSSSLWSSTFDSTGQDPSCEDSQEGPVHPLLGADEERDSSIPRSEIRLEQHI